MNINREEKKKEAIARLHKWHVFDEAIRQFEEDNLISISEPPYGAFYWAEDEDLERIQEFEDEYNALVYMVIRSYTEFGKLDSFLYVSDYEEEWESEWADIEYKEPFVYVYNHDAPWCSEFGQIGVELSVAAGLIRIW